MYDSGDISLKPSDPMHLLMKMDMGGGCFRARRLHCVPCPRRWIHGHRVDAVHRQ